MALSPLKLMMLQGALNRPSRSAGAATPQAAASQAAAPNASAPTPTTAQDTIMANQFEFLDKHFDPTDLPEIAAQTAYERFTLYPNARFSTVIFGIEWTTLVNSIKHAVLNYCNGGVYNASTYATLDNNGTQWAIVLTGLQFVNASRTMENGRPRYEIDEYNNGSVFIKAEALGGQMLGDIVHLDTGFGTWVKQIKLKNPPEF